MRIVFSLLAFVVVSGCAVDPSAERGNDENRYVTGSNIPRRSTSISSDRVESAPSINTGTGAGTTH